MFFPYFDPIYLCFLAPAFLLMLYAQWRVKSAYAKWSQVPNSRRLNGAQAAQSLLTQNGLAGVRMQEISGKLTDNYDPRSKTLNLTQGSGLGTSVASLAIVAHEIGHAQQDASRNMMMAVRSGIVPVVNIGSQLGPWLILGGLLLNLQPITWLGVGLFSLAFIFALITLPVELDASGRAIRMLTSSGFLVGQQEEKGARDVLGAAALTYVASLMIALMQLLYFVLMASGGRRRR